MPRTGGSRSQAQSARFSFVFTRRLRRPAPGSVAQSSPIGQFGLDKQASRLSTLQRADLDGDFIAVLDILILPATLHQNARAAEFDAPMFCRAGIGNVDFDIRVRIG